MTVLLERSRVTRLCHESGGGGVVGRRRVRESERVRERGRQEGERKAGGRERGSRGGGGSTHR